MLVATSCANTKELQAGKVLVQEHIYALVRQPPPPPKHRLMLILVFLYQQELAAPFFGQNASAAGGSGGLGASISSGLLGDGGEMSLVVDSGGGSLTNVVGVIAEEKANAFEKILYRVTRGNTVVRFVSIPEPIFDAQEGKEVSKKVFVGFLQGAASFAKVQRICDVVGAHIYDYNEGEMRYKVEELRGSLKEHQRVVSESEKEIRNTLSQINAEFCAWQDVVTQETGIYATLNRFKYTGGGESGEYVVAEGWIPSSSNTEIRQALQKACSDSGVGQLGATMEKSEPPHGASVPPTYYTVNKYTAAFQSMVEAYGVARYREHNPTPYTIVTFPFLFAVMFGDAGHGLLLLAAAIYFILNEKELGSKPMNEMLEMPFGGRYVLFLMGFFALYTGFIYNEVFGMPLNLYGGTRWHYAENETMAGGWRECYKPEFDTASATAFDDSQMYEGCNLPPKAPYPVGMDPIWKFSNGGLIYFNSLKMKMSVVFGVAQMVFGIILKATNDIKHKRPLDLWCEFVPQVFESYVSMRAPCS